MCYGKKQYITPHPSGSWQVKGTNNSRVTARTNTQAEAISIGRTLSHNQRFELVIHKPNGQIRVKDSHGNDPYPRRG